ncbi:MAG: hypothetical protein JRI55_13300 [Deltaproteobacteria bacterium]|nr:hypothetical protein [Deltaproteobacteria bacterium]
MTIIRIAAVGLAAVLVLAGCSGADGEAAPGPIPPQEGELEALSYNVAGLPEGLSGSHPEAYMPLISPLLNSYDLVLAQEDFVYHEELSQDAEHPYQSVPKQDYVQLVHDGLNRFSQFPWTQLVRVQWVACYGGVDTGASDCMAEKGFSLARTTFGDRITFDVYNHHAEAGGGPEDVEARVAGYEQFAAYIQEHSAGNVVLVGGDTNLHGDDPDDRPVLDQFLAATGLTDACAALDCGDEDRIDRFFFRSNDLVELEPVTWQIADEFVDSDGNDLSDHLAIHVRFAWRTR